MSFVVFYVDIRMVLFCENKKERESRINDEWNGFDSLENRFCVFFDGPENRFCLCDVVEIERELAIKFINDNIEKDAWLEEYFPKQMEVYHNAIEQTREQILNQLNL